MPITVGDLYGQPRTETFDYLEEQLTVTWHPAALTVESEESVRAATEVLAKARTVVAKRGAEAAEERALVAVLVELHVSWDLLDKQGGKPWPTDAKGLGRLPKPFLWDVFNLIAGASGPKAVSEPPSPAS